MTRFSFSFLRLFRLRTRRVAGKGIAHSSVSDKSTRSRSAQVEPIVTTFAPSSGRPRSIFIPAILSPIIQSPVTASSGVTPVLIIGKDPASSSLSTPTSSIDVASSSHVKRVSSINTHDRRVSFRLPSQKEDRPNSTVSACSTLVPDLEACAETATGLAVLPQQSSTSKAADVVSSPIVFAGANADPPNANVALSDSERARPASLFNPQPVRAKFTRFSLPAERTVPILTSKTNTRDDRKGRKRSSLPATPNPASAKKANRTSRWSRELNKPETQEVLRVLASTSFS